MACQKVHKHAGKSERNYTKAHPSLHLSQESEDVGMGLYLLSSLPSLFVYFLHAIPTPLFWFFFSLYVFPYCRQYNQSILPLLGVVAIISNCQQQWLYLRVRVSYCAFSRYSYNSFSCVVPCFTCFYYSFVTTLTSNWLTLYQACIW